MEVLEGKVKFFLTKQVRFLRVILIRNIKKWDAVRSSFRVLWLDFCPNPDPRPTQDYWWGRCFLNNLCLYGTCEKINE
jgi:hypothetical protein